MRAYAEGTGSEHTTVFDVGLGTLLVQDVEQHAVLGLAGHDHHILEVLGAGTNQRDAADVDLLDNVSLRGTTGHGLLEWIKVYDDEVDLRNLVLCHLLLVALVVATAQYASEHLRMQRLHTSAEDRGISRYILYLLALIT